MPAPAGANNRQRGSRRRAFEQAPPPCQRAPGCQPHARTANGVPSARHVPRPPVRAAPAHAPRPRAVCFFPTTQLLTCDSTPTAGAFILQPVAAHACTFCLRAAADTMAPCTRTRRHTHSPRPYAAAQPRTSSSSFVPTEGIAKPCLAPPARRAPRRAKRHASRHTLQARHRLPFRRPCLPTCRLPACIGGLVQAAAQRLLLWPAAGPRV